MIANYLKRNTRIYMKSVQKFYSILILLPILTISSCGLLSSDEGAVDNDLTDPSAQWQRIDTFKGAQVRHLLAGNDFLYMSLTVDSLERGTQGRARLLRTSNGKDWEVIKEDDGMAGPIFIKGDTLGWLTNFRIHQYDGNNWKSIKPIDPGAGPSDDSIILFKGSWYVGGGLFGTKETRKWLDGKEEKKVLPVPFTSEENNGDNWRITGARQYYRYGDKYLGISGTGQTAPGRGHFEPITFGDPNAQFMGGTMIPTAEHVALAGALQITEGRVLISTPFPGYIREWKDENWHAITDTIPTIDYKSVFNSRVDNSAQYIEKFEDRLYISTVRSGVMYWSETEGQWVRSSKGLPRRQDALDEGITNWFINPHYFELFESYLFAGYGYNNTINPNTYNKSISGLYIKRVD